MKRILALLISLLSLTAFAQNPGLLSANDFAKKMFETPGAVLLDVRTPEEFGKGHLKNAQNINWNAPGFDGAVAPISKDAPVFVYCLGGGRSASATAKLRSMGYTQVYELDGGILSWRKAGYVEEGSLARGMTMEQYNALVKSDKQVLVDFYAEWCGPCKLMAPYLEEISRDQAGKVQVLRIDVDQNPELANALQIQALPTLILYKAGKVKWWNVGYVGKKTVLKQIK
ncbi:MAG: thioredoxin [Chitinophagaceae bacterium]|nr:MAG: thioredoxin [Chitinophagaceae bacterium]